MISLALAVGRQSPARVLLGSVGGYLFWTVAEYWMHRFHLPVVGRKSARAAFLIHGVHHDAPWDQTRLVVPAGASLGLCVLTYFAFHGSLELNRCGHPLRGSSSATGSMMSPWLDYVFLSRRIKSRPLPTGSACERFEPAE